MNFLMDARLTPLRREKLTLAVTGGQLSQTQAARVHGV